MADYFFIGSAGVSFFIMPSLAISSFFIASCADAAPAAIAMHAEIRTVVIVFMGVSFGLQSGCANVAGSRIETLDDALGLSTRIDAARIGKAPASA